MNVRMYDMFSSRAACLHVNNSGRFLRTPVRTPIEINKLAAQSIRVIYVQFLKVRYSKFLVRLVRGNGHLFNFQKKYYGLNVFQSLEKYFMTAST